MKKAKLHEFELGVYPRRLWVAKGCKDKELSATFCYRDGLEIEFGVEAGNEPAATTYPMVMLKENYNYGHLLVINEKIDVGMIAHEAGHITTEIFRELGSYLDPNNQEPFMYLLGYIANCIDKVVKNKFDD